MLKNFIHLHSASNNPYLNLALEAFLLDSLEAAPLLFTFVNRPCVVFGNFQNPWIECNLKAMKKEGVLPVRRFSGGGAVYHDFGNLNLSFMRPQRDYEKKLNALFMQEFLQSLGLPVFVNPRSDLRIQASEELIDRKISGSAFKQKRDRSYHHMSLLCQSDLVKLNEYLRSDLELPVESKSIASVRSVVANLNEYIWECSPHFLVEKLSQKTQSSTVITEKEMLMIKEVEEISQEMQTWEFIFGKTPKMEFSYDEGEEKYHFIVNKGVLTSFEVLSSSMHPAFLEELKGKLENQSFHRTLLKDLSVKAEQSYHFELAGLERFLGSFLFWDD